MSHELFSLPVAIRNFEIASSYLPDMSAPSKEQNQKTLNLTLGNSYFLWAPILFILLLYGLSTVDLSKRLEYLSLNARMELRQTLHPAKPHPDLFFLAIDDGSIETIGRWPWDRNTHASLITLLGLSPPKVFTWDIIFSEPQAAYDTEFIQSIMTANYLVVTGAEGNLSTNPEEIERTPDLTQFNRTKAIPLDNISGDFTGITNYNVGFFPIKGLRNSSFFGFVNSDPGVDGVRRHAQLIVPLKCQYYPNLALQSLLIYWNASPEQVYVELGRAITIKLESGDKTIPIDHQARLLMNQRFESSDFISNKQASGYDYLLYILNEHFVNQNPDIEVPDLKNKILLVGQTATALTDLGPSPFLPRSPLCLTHLNVMHNILEDDYMSKPPTWIGWLGVLLLASITVYICEKTPFVISIVIFAATLSVIIGAAILLFTQFSIWTPLVGPALGFTFIHIGSVTKRVFEEQRARQQIRATFSSYLAPGVMEQILSSEQGLELGGKEKSVSILFSDIRDFTSISEHMDVTDLVNRLNEYLTAMVECVGQQKGTLHKFIGDAIMAVWGDVDIISAGVEEDAKRSVRACLAMRQRLVELNAKWENQGLEPFRMGMGINHGNVVVGNIGAPQRTEFTVIGDAVNLASRIEGITKQFRTDFMIGQSVADMVSDEFLLQTAGLIRVKGRTQPERVYFVIGELSAASYQTQQRYYQYEQAFYLYLQRNFQEASEFFQQYLENDPDSHLGQLYLEDCLQYLNEPPSNDWDGVHIFKTK
ncbi:MAG: adenylate/guanylate cyclase domain-containing protein [Verrucomicrobiota bacterium]